ncbi:hypothetical protein BV20DRAFT_399381 [Pilatotrama ljubarskyi]|nr:hypothetical protein BV20DRAFT_399381 [Pilatotrama ljubarskyi]
MPSLPDHMQAGLEQTVQVSHIFRQYRVVLCYEGLTAAFTSRIRPKSPYIKRGTDAWCRVLSSTFWLTIHPSMPMIIKDIASRSYVYEDSSISQVGTIGAVIGGIAGFVFFAALCVTIARCVRAAENASRVPALTVVQPTQTAPTQMTVVNNTVAISCADPPPPYAPPAAPVTS